MTRIAAILTEYRPNTHADVMVDKFLRGFPTDEGLIAPRVQIASMYLDQVNPGDIGVQTARAFGVPIYPSILRALTLGGDDLAVDGVLIVGEHGDYPRNEKGQKLYPRRYFFEQVAGVISTAGRAIPVFSDKHLSYNWGDALWMVQRARELSMPLMAGSSLPTCWRSPFTEVPLGARLEGAVAIGYGLVEDYGFHALEVLQCMVERRGHGAQGAETGVAAVQCLEGRAVWDWLDANPNHAALARAACEPLAKGLAPWEQAPHWAKEPAAFIVDYIDGLKAAVLMLNGYARSFAFSGAWEGRVHACEFRLQTDNAHGHWSYLGLNVEEMFVSGCPSYPVERTLLTSGVLEAAMDSRYRGHAVLSTPHLRVAYVAPERAPHRPAGPGPSGATLQPWPPQGDPLGRAS